MHYRAKAFSCVTREDADDSESAAHRGLTLTKRTHLMSKLRPALVYAAATAPGSLMTCRAPGHPCSSRLGAGTEETLACPDIHEFGFLIGLSCQMSRDRSVVRPPVENTAIPSLVGSGKIWSVMATRPPLANTSTDDQST